MGRGQGLQVTANGPADVRGPSKCSEKQVWLGEKTGCVVSAAGRCRGRGGPAAAERPPGVRTVLRSVGHEGTILLGRLISKDKVGKGLPFTPVS